MGSPVMQLMKRLVCLTSRLNALVFGVVMECLLMTRYGKESFRRLSVVPLMFLSGLKLSLTRCLLMTMLRLSVVVVLLVTVW